MALFKGRKQDADKTAAALAEFQRTAALAQQSTAQAEQMIGMDVQSIMNAAAQSMSGGGMQAMMEYRNRTARVFQNGVELPATLESIQCGQHSPVFGGIPAQFRVRVEPPGYAPYEVSTDQTMDPGLAQSLVAGQRITVKVDQQDPQCLLIWGTSQSVPGQVPETGQVPAQAPSAADDRAQRLAKLQELRSMGVLTDAEFETQQAKLLNG